MIEFHLEAPSGVPAYLQLVHHRELDREGLTEGRQDDVKALRKWIAAARAAGLDDENMYALFADVVRPPTVSRVA